MCEYSSVMPGIGQAFDDQGAKIEIEKSEAFDRRIKQTVAVIFVYPDQA